MSELQVQFVFAPDDKLVSEVSVCPEKVCAGVEGATHVEVLVFQVLSRFLGLEQRKAFRGVYLRWLSD